MARAEVDKNGVVKLPAREIPPPTALSDQARAVLGAPRLPPRAYPPASDKAGWKKLIAANDGRNLELAAQYMDRLQVDLEDRTMAGRPVYVGTPRGKRLIDTRHVVLDIHGGALVFGGGQMTRVDAAAFALRTGRVTYALDYRVPPDHPYPAPLDDCVNCYRELLKEKKPEEIVVLGTSAGGNLAGAMLLKARDQGLPLPAGAILLTPEVDLTESGDTFDTLMGLDSVLTDRLMPINELYANGADLADPYLSPMFGDFTKGYPPTLLQAGTRDIFLSNAVRMHRRLRDAGVRAELHVWDGMPHAGFGGVAPEDREINAEMQRFIASL